MDIQIRLAKSHEVEEILELQANSLRTSSLHYNSRQIESLIRSQASARFRFREILFVAEYENKVVGFISLSIHQPQINGLFVHPDFMRQGIGTRLIEVLERTAVEKKYKRIRVLSALAAVGFYQKRGYIIIRKSGFFSELTTWIPCMNLEKRLVMPTTTEKWIERIALAVFWLVLILSIMSRLLPLIISLIASVLSK